MHHVKTMAGPRSGHRSSSGKPGSHVSAINTPRGPFYTRGLTLFPSWIIDYIHYNLWDKIIYSFPNLISITSKYAKMSYHTILGMWLHIHGPDRCRCRLGCVYPYPEAVYTGWSSVHCNATGAPLVDPVYTGIPLGDPATTWRVHWNTTGKLIWNCPTLECH